MTIAAINLYTTARKSGATSVQNSASSNGFSEAFSELLGNPNSASVTSGNTQKNAVQSVSSVASMPNILATESTENAKAERQTGSSLSAARSPRTALSANEMSYFASVFPELQSEYSMNTGFNARGKRVESLAAGHLINGRA